jgi:hypothetical protein
MIESISFYYLFILFRKEVLSIELTDRDFKVLQLVGRFRFLTGNHIQSFCFQSERTKERRLKMLVDNHYLHREKVLYGFPFLYTLTHKGRMILGLNKRPDKIRIDRIKHDMIVLDVVILILNKYQITTDVITTEKELHRKDGFGNRKHQPDFTFLYQEKTYAVEIELTVKDKNTLEKNIKQNYMEYDFQLWYIEKQNNKLIRNLGDCTRKYDNIHIFYLG